MPSEYNPQLVENMSAKFRRLNNPTHAMADAVGMLQMLPGVAGIWHCATGGGSGSKNKLTDLSGNGLHLSRNGTASVDAENLVSYIDYNGTTGYYSYADDAAFDIQGNETYVNSSWQGLTIGGWFYFDAVGSFVTLAGKRDASTNLSYYIQMTSGNVARFVVSGDGSTAIVVDSTDTISTGVWKFICGRYDPSDNIVIFLNDEKVANFTSIPATIFNGSGNFAIGASGHGANFLNGRSALIFLCASLVQDQFITTFYQMTAPLFGVTV